jgi:hypothetical protein
MDKRDQIAEIICQLHYEASLSWITPLAKEELLKVATSILALFPEPSVEEIQQQVYYLLEHTARGLYNLEECSNVIAQALSKLQIKGEGDSNKIIGIRLKPTEEDTNGRWIGVDFIADIYFFFINHH